MIRIASQPKSAAPVWHEAFMSLLPKICYYARFAFRHLDPEARQEAIQNVVAAALNAYVRLVQLGKADIAYATPLAKYAIRQHNDGRRLGCRLNVRDVSSEYAQKMKSFCLQKLDHYDETEDGRPGRTRRNEDRLPRVARHAQTPQPQDCPHTRRW
jgi:hypothetical protein